MGMAASQARFLQLTARRSNNEYMGQQINQARTALANKSAGLFEQMLTLKPPTPPSSTDDKYYAQGYTFLDSDDLRKKITWDEFRDLDPIPADLSVSGDIMGVTYYEDDGTGTGTTQSATVNFTGVTVEGEELLDALGLVDEEVRAIFEAADGNLSTAQTNLANYLNYPTVDPETGDPYTFELPEDTHTAAVRWVTLEHTAYDPEGNFKLVEEKIPAVLFFDNRERLLSFNELNIAAPGWSGLFDDSYNPGTNGAGGIEGGQTDASGTIVTVGPPTLDDIIMTSPTMEIARVEMGDELAYSGQFDQEAFNDDMNRYEFDKSAYDYQVERINIETAQLQQQDKSLELKLKQIDTDHNAIQTEMEAVQKVIKKNIETTFKTFA